MKLKIITVLLAFVLLVSGCQKVKETVDIEASKEDVITNSFADNYYDIVSSTPSAIRERVYGNLASNEDDYKTVGRGLQLLSLNYFSNKEHLIREGSFTTPKDYQELLLRGKDYPYSIQIPNGTTVDGVETSDGSSEQDATKIKTPVLFDTMYQQDYVKKNDNGYQLAGISVALVLSPEYYADLNGSKALSPTDFSDETIQTYSKRAIELTYQYYKETYSDLADVPMLICVYQLAKSTDEVSGHYIYSCYCDNSIGDIKSVDEDTVIFTSEDARKLDSVTYDEFVLIKEKVKNFATEAVGMIGTAKYQDQKIQSMMIELNLNTKTYTEEIAIMNYLANLLDTGFTTDFYIKVNVNSQDNPTGTIIKEAGQKAKSYLDY